MSWFRAFSRAVVLLVLFCVCRHAAAQQRVVIPHHQDKPPGPALSPEEAVKKMTVPEGFRVEIVACEPQLVNPIGMTFDERGRVWVTESLEYPRRSPGQGRDRVKVLEDTDGDGRMDKVTVFAEGLNIPSGIAVGYGGVWVANSPDILFLQDTDGDGKADKRKVVVTGFGRSDTHELPNSLTWGPDGWLYGLNGVFNHSHVKHQGREYRFTCALFRINPRPRTEGRWKGTHDFELFAEGTSNPWGVAWDHEGSAFLSACVIDHLWHLTETGYYHRQGGPYPPHTWKIDSIVEHKHQKAAYCGIHFFDSPAYPEQYRGRLYMGNIHGNCINCDVLERDGSTYFATPAPDFLTANDAWFMPVVQKTGPDGSLYILDWYDRYHCYQDANRDPQGIDRLKGRLYRVRYQDTPRVHGFDLAKSSDDELLEELSNPNVYFRDIAQRLLAERNTPAIRRGLEARVRDESLDRKYRMHALFARVACGGSEATYDEDQQFLAWLLEEGRHPSLQAWGVRAAGNYRHVDPALRERIAALARGAHPDVLVQVAVAARKIDAIAAVPMLSDVLAHCGEDKLIPHIVWANLQPLLEDDADAFLEHVRASGGADAPGFARMMPRLIERLLARRGDSTASVVALFAALASGENPQTEGARQCLDALARMVQSREIRGARLESLKASLEPKLAELIAAGSEHPLYVDAALLATTWRSGAALAAVRGILADGNQPEPRRLQALAALMAALDEQLLGAVETVLEQPKQNSPAFRGQLLASLGRLSDPRVAAMVLNRYASLEAELKPKAVELLTQRSVWTRQLLEAIRLKRVPSSALNVNQVRRILASGDQELAALVKETWGTIRSERDPRREQLLARMRYFIRRNPGDAHRGAAVFKKVCGQCHKMYGEGNEVGPDITRNGRNSFEQLLSNVFDPSLVIGADYQARTVVTADGRVLTGLLVEDSPQRVVLKMQGGKLETLARDDVEQMVVSKLSMMPEGLEQQIKPAEMADLWAYVTLDRPPSDPEARRLPGVYDVQPRETRKPEEFTALLAEVAPGFTTGASGEGGVGLLGEYRGRKIVVRTHPVSEQRPCVLRGTFDLPAGARSRLHLAVSHDPRGDWQLVVRAGRKVLAERLIGGKSDGDSGDGWTKIELDLTPLAGKQVKLEVENRANDWSWEFAYWGRVEVVTETPEAAEAAAGGAGGGASGGKADE